MRIVGLRHTLGNLALFLVTILAPALAIALLGLWALQKSGQTIDPAIFVPRNPEHVGAILFGIFAFPTLYFGWRSLRQGRRMTRLAMRAQVVQKCIDRYEEIEDERQRALLGDPTKREAALDLYFRRYWALQSDQIDFYLAGWLDFDTLRSWVYGLCRRLLIEPDPGPHTMRESWKIHVVTHDQANPLFASIVDAILAFADAGELDDKDPSSLDAKIMALTDALFVIISQETEVDREMLQRKYGVHEFLNRVSATRGQEWFRIGRVRKHYRQRLRKQAAIRGGKARG